MELAQRQEAEVITIGAISALINYYLAHSLQAWVHANSFMKHDHIREVKKILRDISIWIKNKIDVHCSVPIQFSFALMHEGFVIISNKYI